MSRLDERTKQFPDAGRAQNQDPARRLTAVAAGVVLLVVGVAGLHHLARAGDGVGELLVWGGLLLGWFTALGGGVKLAAWGLKPVTTALFDTVTAKVSEPAQAVIAALAVLTGSAGLWWVLRGGYSLWWQQLSAEPGWTLVLGVGQMLIAVLSGAMLFTGGNYLAGLAREVLTGVGSDEGVHRFPSAAKTSTSSGQSHPALLAALLGGGVALVVMTAWLVPILLSTITGSSVLPAVSAIAVMLTWAVGANLGWWHGLTGLYRWVSATTNKATAVAGVAAILAFSAGGLGLGWFTSETVPLARAACPPDCGGGGGLDGPPGGGQMFQPPSQGGPQMPDYQGGINQPPLDQNGSVSIYNTQAPSITQNGSSGYQSSQGPQQGWDQPAHGTQIPDYQSAPGYTQGPGKPNPDWAGNQPAQQGGQPNTGNQGAQPNQSVQQPQQANQGAQQPQQQPSQSDSQRVEDLTRQLQDQQQQNQGNQQRIDELTKQLQQQKQQQNNNQKLPRLPEQGKDKKKDQQDQDGDSQSGGNDLAALLLGSASTRRRKPDQQRGQPQGPDTQALTKDSGQLASGLPGDIANTVSDSANLGQSAGSAAQNFGSAAQAGASIASSAQGGAVNPMDAVAVVQGVSGGISDTAEAVNSGAQIASTWLENGGEAAQLAADVNPQLQAQAQQVQQMTEAGGQVADLTGQAASGVSQVSGMVNTASSFGTSGVPTDVPANVQSVDLQSGEVPEGVATAVDFKQAPADPVGPLPEPPVPPRVSQLPSAQQMKSMTDIEIFGLSKEAQVALNAYDAQFPKVIPQPQYQAYLDGRAPLVAVKEAYDAQLASRGITFGPLGGEVEYNQQTGSILRFRDYPAKPGDPTRPWNELGTPESPAPNAAGGALESVTIDEIMANPQLLSGRTPQEVEAALGNVPGWRVETLGRGSQEGNGWVFRQYTEQGNPTGLQLRWHPGGGHHGPGPYWRVKGPNGNIGGDAEGIIR